MTQRHSNISFKNLGSGFWALADQGVVSLGNFMTQIVLARSLSRLEYGIFALLFGVLLALFICHGSLITYPLSLTGAVADNNELKKLMSDSLSLTFLFAFFLAPVVFGAAWVLKVSALGWVALLALLLWMFQETARRALMAHLLHRRAIWGDGISYIGQAAILWIFAQRGHITLPIAFLILAATSGIAALLQILQVGVAFPSVRRMLRLARSYWSRGRWALFTMLSDGGSRQVFPWTLALLFGPQEAASFQAAMNVVGVSHPVLFGASNLIIPAASRTNKEHGARPAFRISVAYGALAMAILVPYFIFLLFWPGQALSILYGKASVYTALGLGVRLAALAYLFGAIGALLAGYLLGIDRPKYAFGANLGAAAVALIPAAILTVRYGVYGAIAGFLVWMIARTVLCAILVRRIVRMHDTRTLGMPYFPSVAEDKPLRASLGK